MLIQTVKPAALMRRSSSSPRRSSSPESLRLSQIVSALSYALDLTEGRPMGHSVRSCLIGMRLAKHIGMSVADQGQLFYALLLKDAGCSSNASKLFHILSADDIQAKRDVKLTDWTRVGWESLQYALGHVAVGAPFLERVGNLVRIAAQRQTDSRDLVKIRCERGASIARRIGFAEPVAQGIHSLDEHWSGGGYPDSLRGPEIPLFSRIMNLAQTLEVFLVNRGASAAIEVADARDGRWFDPDLVRAARSLAKDGSLWADLDREQVIDRVLHLEPEQTRLPANDETIENICQAFAEIVDAKSPFTYRHSNGVADAAVGISCQMGLSSEDVVFLRRAALLHDIGKLGVSNTILEKPAKLDQTEWTAVRKHPFYSQEILRKIPGFEDLSEVAGAHHEKLDGSGYYRGWDAEQLSLEMRILTVADIFDALAAKRPYRDALPVEKVFEIMKKDAARTIDAACLEALIAYQGNLQSSTGEDLIRLAANTGVAAQVETEQQDSTVLVR